MVFFSFLKYSANSNLEISKCPNLSKILHPIRPHKVTIMVGYKHFTLFQFQWIILYMDCVVHCVPMYSLFQVYIVFSLYTMQSVYMCTVHSKCVPPYQSWIVSTPCTHVHCTVPTNHEQACRSVWSIGLGRTDTLLAFYIQILNSDKYF